MKMWWGLARFHENQLAMDGGRGAGGNGRKARSGFRSLERRGWRWELGRMEWGGMARPPPAIGASGPSRRCVGSLRRTSAAEAFAERFGHALGRVAVRQGGTKGEGARARARAGGGTCGAACGLGRPPVAEDAARIVDGNGGRSASVSDRVCRTPTLTCQVSDVRRSLVDSQVVRS